MCAVKVKRDKANYSTVPVTDTDMSAGSSPLQAVWDLFERKLHDGVNTDVRCPLLIWEEYEL